MYLFHSTLFNVKRLPKKKKNGEIDEDLKKELPSPKIKSIPSNAGSQLKKNPMFHINETFCDFYKLPSGFLMWFEEYSELFQNDPHPIHHNELLEWTSIMKPTLIYLGDELEFDVKEILDNRSFLLETLQMIILNVSQLLHGSISGKILNCNAIQHAFAV